MCRPSGGSGIDGARDSRREFRPALRLRAQVGPSGRGQRVVLGVAPGLTDPPLLGEQAFALETMERRIERPLLNDDVVGRGLADPSADGIAVAWSPADGLEDE